MEIKLIKQRRFRRRSINHRSGQITLIMAAITTALFGFAALALDLGYIALTKSQMKNAADASVHACAGWMFDNGMDDLEAARAVAVQYAQINMVNAGTVLAEDDVVFGVWDTETRTFTETNDSINAVKVTVQRSQANGNPVPLFFAAVWGHTEANMSAAAVAMVPLSSGGPEFKYLLDDEMFDSDVTTIEDLANQLGEDSDDIISDLDGDGFIDLPAGEQLELPTGQVGDEGMFDTTSWEGAFPFTTNSIYTQVDFLAEGTELQDILQTQELQDVEWESGEAPHEELEGNKVLDPVTGIDPMDSHQDILDLPDPNVIYISPVFKSDVSMAETDPSKYGSPAANLQGERRGLVAYKIISARPNPDGGSYLPLVTIEIVDPSTIDIENLDPGGSGGSGSRGASSHRAPSATNGVIISTPNGSPVSFRMAMRKPVA